MRAREASGPGRLTFEQGEAEAIGHLRHNRQTIHDFPTSFPTPVARHLISTEFTYAQNQVSGMSEQFTAVEEMAPFADSVSKAEDLSVSLATVEVQALGAGTRLIFTQQAAFLEGYNDLAGREDCTRGGWTTWTPS